MKPIIIKEDNREAIEAAIKEAEGRATVRTIDYDEITCACYKITEKLGISKKSMEGIVAHIDLNAQHFANAYMFSPESTHFTLQYKNGTWRLIQVFRERCWDALSCYHVTLTEEAKAALIANAQVF